MKTSPREQPAWLKWTLRVCGLALLAAASLPLYWAVLDAMILVKGYSGPQALPGDKWTAVLTQLVIHAVEVFVAVALGIVLFRRASAVKADASEEPRSLKTRSSSRTSNWNACNVVGVGPAARQLWQFDGSSYVLHREQTTMPGEPLPPGLVSKNWSSLWNKKLNIAWLPPQHVFIRVAQFPQSSEEETRAMVELQLERLSPIPVTQAVWTMHAVPHPAGNMQTVVLLIVSRSVVEEFLGTLESEGYLADRLELPLLDQLQATEVTEDGAWIYPEAQGGRNTAVVAWWYGGVLQAIDLLTLPAEGNLSAGLKDQLMQMAWAGEMDGWLTSPPKWHLVGDGATPEWAKALEEGLEQPVERVTAIPARDLAARTARRAAVADPHSTLLPGEYAARYRQQFVDRLWIRGLGAVVAVYVLGLVVYFAALTVLKYQTKAAEQQFAAQAPTYTNAMRLNAEYKVLKERQELKFAALDCYMAVAETLPAGLTMDVLSLTAGKTMSIRGTCPADQVLVAIDFCNTLRKYSARNQPLFEMSNEAPRTQVLPGGMVQWSYDLTLRRTGE